MGKSKKGGGKGGGDKKKKKPKKSFLDNQKRKKNEMKSKVKNKENKRKEEDAHGKERYERTFKFETFSDKIAATDYSIVYQLAGNTSLHKGSDDLQKSVFHGTLNHWLELNQSADFTNAVRRLRKYITLPQVLYSHSAIVEVLKTGLESSSELSVQPFLELTAGLATDLQHEFFPYLESFNQIFMTKILVIKNSDVIKWTFRCMSHLLKILWRPISQNLESVYTVLAELFNSKKPDYIRYMGAEAISFLFRKCKDKKTFTSFILSQINDATDPVAISKLFFESLKTVNHQFNTQLESTLDILMEILPEAHPTILSNLIQFCCEHTNHQYVTPIFDKLCLEAKNTKTHEDLYFQCLNIFITSNNGVLVKNLEKVTSFFQECIKEKTNSEELLNGLKSLLAMENIYKSHDDYQLIMDMITKNSFDLNSICDFITEMQEKTEFDMYYLKPYLAWVQIHIAQNFDQLSKHLCDLIAAKNGTCQFGPELETYKSFSYDLNLVPSLRKVSKEDLFTNLFVDQLKTSSNVETITNSLTICMCLKPLNKDKVLENIASFLGDVLDGKNDEKISTLPSVIRCLCVLLPQDKVASYLDLEKICSLYLTKPASFDYLQLLNFALTCHSWQAELVVQEANLEELFSALSSQLATWDPVGRQLALHSLTLLIPLLGDEYTVAPEENYLSILEIVQTLLQAQTIPETLSDYKNKLNLLRNVEAERLHSTFRQNEKFVGIVVRFLLGSLYTNLTLLWEPLQTMVSAFGNSLQSHIFWTIFGGHLSKASDDISELVGAASKGGGNGHLVTVDGRKVDVIKYRNRLWLLMAKFAEVMEPRNRGLVTLFLDTFLAKEYVDIRQLSDEKGKSGDYKEIISTTISSLVAHLTVFSHFKDLKSVHRSAELRSKVEELLCHRVASVQKVALRILLAYKLKFILPYKEHLERLLDDKEFKKELLEFPLTAESTEIKSEHRDELMPIILRLLYGRMRSAKRGKEGGKGSKQLRRTQILHYIMDLSEDHIRYFLSIIFHELYTDCDMDGVSSVFEYILAGKPAPTKECSQLQAILDTTHAVIAKLGHLMDKNLGYILETIVWIGYIVDSACRSTGKVSVYKTVRNSVYALISTFYAKFPTFAYTQQIDGAIFKSFVWQSLENFDRDFIHSPSGLLQLVLTWSRERSYHRYFLVTDVTHQPQPLLHNIAKVLVKSVTANKVTNTVLDVVNNLVTPPSMEDTALQGETEDTTGIGAVLQVMDPLISHFNTWVHTNNQASTTPSPKSKTKKKKPLNVGVKLDILRNLAPYISDPATALQFIEQLLIMLSAVKKSETVCKVVQIVQYLTEKIDDNVALTKIVNLILPFYGKLELREEFLEFSKLMEVIRSKNNADLERLCTICIKLTSYDKKRFEEPDFEARMTQFMEIRDGIRKQEKLSVLEITALAYICCNNLRIEKDSALKANSLDTLLVLCMAIKQSGETDAVSMDRLISRVLLELIREGIKTKEDIIRVDFVHFLQKLVEDCGQLSGRLKDLVFLVNKDQPEVDFFENSRHVQLHRRARALVRLAGQIKENPELFTEKNLVQLLLPLGTCYLMDPAYTKQSDLVEKAISFFGTVCSVLSWQTYESYIKYYLGLFKKENVNQKQLVKITIAILNAFHFPLDISGLDEQTELTDKEKEKRRRIHNTVNSALLPRLTNMLAGKAKTKAAAIAGTEASGLESDDELILRVPLAVPVVKILQLNSAAIVEQHIPGIIAKIASFLKSKALEIRESARTTLNTIMEMLGPRFIKFVIQDISGVLTRGYQVHVLTFTVHGVLHNLMEKGQLKSGDLDTSVSSLASLALQEMFGVTAEEKEVKKITGKLLEAKNTKSYDTLQITAKYISSQHILNLVQPFADKLKEFSTFKNISKIKECLRNIALGLLANESLDPMMTIMFIYALLTDNFNLVNNKPVLKKEEKVPVVQKPDSYLIAPEPKRGGSVAKHTSASSNYVIQEFGLNLLYFLLKRNEIDSKSEEHCARCEPFFPILLGFLDSAHASVIAVTLRCFIWFVKLPLESRTDDNLLELTNKVFALLKRYGGGTDCKGENQDLVLMASKLLVVLIRHVKLTQIKDDQLKVVFEYVIIDVMDPMKQTTAFGMLNAVLSRKLVHADLHGLMMKLAEMIIQTNYDRIRQAARSALMNYVTHYELKAKLGEVLDFFVAQLSYEIEEGRLAAAHTLTLLFKSISGKLNKHVEYLFVSMAPHLSNAESEDSRNAIAKAITTLLTVIDADKAANLLSSTMKWFQSENSSAQVMLATRLINVFVDALGLNILKSDLKTILKKLVVMMKSSDALVIQVLVLLQKMVRSDESNSILKNSEILDGLQTCLLHPHAWIRLLASQLLGLYLTASGKDLGLKWLTSSQTLKSVILDSFEQLKQSDSVTSELSVQVTKNLVALTKLITDIKSDDADEDSLSLEYTLKRAVKLGNNELVSTPQIVTHRTLVFNYIAAVALQMAPQIKDLLSIILTPLLREISDPSKTNAELKSHAQEVLDLVKSKFVDDETFTKTLLDVQLMLTRKRGERNAKRKQNLIKNPELAAKRKLNRAEARKAKKMRQS